MVFLVPFEYRHIFLVRYTIGFSLIFILLFYPVFIYCKRIKHYNTMLISRQVNKKDAFCANISYAPQTILPKQWRDLAINEKYDKSDYRADGIYHPKTHGYLAFRPAHRFKCVMDGR